MNTQAISYPDSNKVGKFNVPAEILRDGAERPALQALFGLCVVLDARDHESGRGKTYIAASELFQPLTENEEIPEYRIEFAQGRTFPNAEHEARRTNSGAFGFVAIRQIVVRVPPVQLGAAMRAPGRLH